MAINFLDGITVNGNVGIGTTSPAEKLDVAGNIKTTGQIQVTPATGYGTIEIGGPSGGFIDLKGPSTDDYDLRIISGGSGGSFWTGGYGHVMTLNSSGNVGIGTTTPATKLDVNGDTIVRGNVGINGATSIDSPLDIAAASTGNNALFQKWYYSPNAETYNLQLKQTVTSGVVRYNFSMVNNSTAYNDVLVLDRGKVGIGTTSPAQKLTVNGTIMSTGSSNPTLILQDSTHSDITIKGDSGIFSVTNQSVGQNITMLYNGNVGIGTTNPVSKLQVNGTFTSAGVSNVGTGANTSVYLTASSGTGKVGVGTTSPAEKLDVNGNVKASGYKTSSGTGVTTNVTVRNQNNSNTVTFQIVGGIIVGIT